MKKSITFVLAILLGTALLAHEYVLIAYKYVVKKGDNLELHLFVSDGFNIELERPVQKSITKSFELISEHGKTNLLGTANEGDLPVLKMKVDFEGLAIVHMERDYAKITMANTDFENYLKLDNIENISIEKTKKAEQTERYTRYLKALIQSNIKENDTLFKTRIGHTFEIVPLQNPYTLQKNDWIFAQVFFMGKPLSNKVITARNRVGNEPATVQYSRTDANGICSFKLEREGNWFFHATHMIPSTDQTEADWESFWTTLSFGFQENH